MKITVLKTYMQRVDKRPRLLDKRSTLSAFDLAAAAQRTAAEGPARRR
jgi:hypothetical protein